MLSRLNVERVLDVYTGEDGHVGLRMRDGATIVVHPRREFTVRGTDIAVERIPYFEKHVIGLAHEVAHLKKGIKIRIGATVHAEADKRGRAVLARWFPTLARRMGPRLPKNARLRAVLLEVSSEIGVALDPPAHVDIYVTRDLPAAKISRGFLERDFDLALQTVSGLGSK